MAGEQVSRQGRQHRAGSNGHRPRVVVVIPAYNEERFIGSVVLQARQHAAAVLVVDDGSADATADVAAAAGATVIRQSPNGGKGTALGLGFRHALELQPDVVVTLDADGQHVAGEIEQVAAPVLRGDADIVVGSRYLDDNSDVPGHRIFGHRLFNFMTNRASGVPVTDSQSGFRAFSPRALRTISFNSNGFSVESEMQFIAEENDLTLVEAPVTIHYRDRPKRPVLAHGLMVLNGLLTLMGQYRPLLFFGVPGALVMGLAGLWSLWIIRIFQTRGELAIGYALIAVILFLVGNAIMTTGIILHSVRGLLLNYLVRKSGPLSQADRGIN